MLRLRSRTAYYRAFLALTRSASRRDRPGVLKATSAMLAADPRDAFAMTMRADALDGVGQEQEACRLRHAALEIEPKNILALQGLAEFYARTNRVELACEAIRRALAVERRPWSIPSWVGKLLSLVGKLRNRDIKEEMDRGVRRAKKDEKRWRSWAERYLAMHGDSVETSEPVN